MTSVLKTFYKEKENWDRVTTRYDQSADTIAVYRYPCESLTFPYTALIWIMADFIKEYYLSDIQGFEAKPFTSASRAFWKKAKQSAFYQYQKRNNRSFRKTNKNICRNLVSIYKEIESKGYNLAKPVPVSENYNGQVVTLKGAKRIAVLIVFGHQWISVKEVDRKTLDNIVDAEQEVTLCRNHTRTIFNSMADIPYVKDLMVKYEQHAHAFKESEKKVVLDGLLQVIDDLKRQENCEILKTSKNTLAPLIQSLDIMKPPGIAVVIIDDIEVVEWLYRRMIANLFIITKPEVYDMVLQKFKAKPVQIVKAVTKEEIYQESKNANCSEIWVSGNIAEELRPGENEGFQIKEFISG